MQRLNNFISSSYQKKKLIIRCLFLLSTIRIGLWVMPFKWINDRYGNEESDQEFEANWNVISEIADTVEACSKYVPGATCLTQAFTALRLLRGFDQPCRMAIGAEKQGDGIKAHAWIEVDNQVVIGKHPDLDRFVRFKAVHESN